MSDINEDIDYEHIARLIAKKAISEVTISQGISEVDIKILFEELDKIGESLTEDSIKDKDNWLPFSRNDFGSSVDW